MILFALIMPNIKTPQTQKAIYKELILDMHKYLEKDDISCELISPGEYLLQVWSNKPINIVKGLEKTNNVKTYIVIADEITYYNGTLYYANMDTLCFEAIYDATTVHIKLWKITYH